jgi:hypothetical protein
MDGLVALSVEANVSHPFRETGTSRWSLTTFGIFFSQIYVWRPYEWAY